MLEGSLLESYDVKLVLPIPPSTNHIYARTRGGGVALTTEAQRFREDVKKLVVQQIGVVSKLPVDPENVYRMVLNVYFESLQNPGWFEVYDRDTYVTRGKRKGELLGRQGERKAKTRYKVLDIDNRVKFLQDCVCKSLGIPNDCQVFRTSQAKFEDSNPRVEVLVEAVDPKTFLLGKE